MLLLTLWLACCLLAAPLTGLGGFAAFMSRLRSTSEDIADFFDGVLCLVLIACCMLYAVRWMLI